MAKEKIRIRPDIQEYLIKEKRPNKVEIGEAILTHAHEWLCKNGRLKGQQLQGLPLFFYIQRKRQGAVIGFWPLPDKEYTVVISG